MSDPKNPKDQVSVPVTDNQPNAAPLNDAQLDELSDSMLDQASGGVTSGGGPS